MAKQPATDEQKKRKPKASRVSKPQTIEQKLRLFSKITKDIATYESKIRELAAKAEALKLDINAALAPVLSCVSPQILQPQPVSVTPVVAPAPTPVAAPQPTAVAPVAPKPTPAPVAPSLDVKGASWDTGDVFRNEDGTPKSIFQLKQFKGK